MASSGGDWIVTMDEDGQHDPAYIGEMLDVALGEQASVVYATPTNRRAARRAAQRRPRAAPSASSARSAAARTPRCSTATA